MQEALYADHLGQHHHEILPGRQPPGFLETAQPGKGNSLPDLNMAEKF